MGAYFDVGAYLMLHCVRRELLLGAYLNSAYLRCNFNSTHVSASEIEMRMFSAQLLVRWECGLRRSRELEKSNFELGPFLV